VPLLANVQSPLLSKRSPKHKICNISLIPAHTWSAIMVCSKRGPTIALSRGCWLLLQIPLRLGDCMVRNSSPCSTLSWRTLSWLPSEEVGVALVAETGDLGWRPLGSLAGIGLSGVVLYALRRAGSLLGAARRVRESIVAVMWWWWCCVG
jgi:hypothetical protein